MCALAFDSFDAHRRLVPVPHAPRLSTCSQRGAVPACPSTITRKLNRFEFYVPGVGVFVAVVSAGVGGALGSTSAGSGVPWRLSVQYQPAGPGALLHNMSSVVRTAAPVPASMVVAVPPYSVVRLDRA